MSEWDLVIYAGVAFMASIFSAIAGAGGGFITTPLLIFLGLSPAQAVATGKIGGVAVTVGALSGMRSAHGRVSKWRILPVMVLALIVGLIVPFIIKSLDSDVYRMALGVILLAMIPVIVYKKVGLKSYKPKLWQKYAGSGLLTAALFLQGIFSGGLGSLVNVVLMGMLGMTAIEANITKRWSQLILNATIIVGVFGSGLIIWKVAIVTMCFTLVGGYIGGRLAVHKGDGFVMKVMIILMLISAVGLIAGA
jgi:uncharacterized membrane protein YfcA